MSLEDSNKQRVEEFFKLMCSGDVEGLCAAYTEDGSCWTSGNTLISGTMDRDQVAAGAGGIFEVFPGGLEFTIDAMTAEGERVAVEAQSKGMHISGKLYHNLYHFLFEFRDGKVLRLKEYMDTEMVTDILCGGARPQ